MNVALAKQKRRPKPGAAASQEPNATLMFRCAGPTATGGEARSKFYKPPNGLVERKCDAYRGLVVELDGERHGGALVGRAAAALAALSPNQRRQSAKNGSGGKLRQRGQRHCASVQTAQQVRTYSAHSPPRTRPRLERDRCCARPTGYQLRPQRPPSLPPN